MKKMTKLMLMAALAVGAASCSKNDEPDVPTPDAPAAAQGVFVLNQGIHSKQIEGSLTLIDYDSADAEQDLFQRANGRSLGSTPQAGVVYGSKIYLAIYDSNIIEIVDRDTYKSVKQISLAGAEGQSPRSFAVKDGKVYISMFNGYVSRVDTLSLAIDKTVKVGPNPEIMAIRGDYLYVPNSDGLNYMVGYGTTASKIDLKTFTVAKTFTVGLNPAEFVSNGTDLFLLCKGNYGDTASKIYSIDNNDESTEIDEATMLAIKGGKLYYINAPYGAPEFTYTTLDIATGSKKKMLADNGVDSPAGIGVDPVCGNIVISSYSMDGGSTSYITEGYAKVYDPDGVLVRRYDVGVTPVAIFFK